MVWIGMINENTQTVEVVASHGNIGDYLDRINIDLNDEKQSNGPTGKAIKTNTHQICNDIAESVTMDIWKERALKYGYRSSAAFPLSTFHKVVGTINFYSDEINFFQEEDVQLLDELAKDISFALEFIEIDAKRSENEELLKQLAAIVESSDDAIIGKNLEGIITSWNKGAIEIYGYTESEMIGNSVSVLIPSDKADELSIILAKIKNGEHTEHFETVRQKKDGQLIHVALTISPIKDTLGQIVGASTIARDISERKHHEAINASRIHLMQFATIHSLDELLEETLNIAEKLSKSQIGFFHFVEDDQLSLTLQNWSTGTKAKFCKAEGKGMHYPIDRAGVWAVCVAQRKPVIHNDYASLPDSKGWPKGHANVIRELVVPVMRGEKIVAILGVGNKRTDYDEKDVETISLLANLSWEISERKRTDEALFESEKKYRTLIQKMQTAVVVHGANTQIITSNAKAQELLGLTEDQLLGKTAIDPSWHFYREDMSVMPFEEYPVNLVLATRKELRNYIVGVHRPNIENYIWAFVNADPVFDDKDGINQVIISFIDITHLKKTEEALRTSEGRFRRLAENARDLIYRMSLPDGKYEYVSPAAYSMFGYSPEEFYAYPSLIQQIIHPDWHNYFEEQWTNLLKGEMPPTYEYQIIQKSGEVRWLNQRNILVCDENGNPIAIEGIVTDITRRKHTENQLRLNEERFRMAQTISHTGNWEYNLQTTHFWGSDEAKRIYGFDLVHDSFTTEEVENCIPEREQVHQALVDLIEQNKPYDLEFEIHPKNSSESRVITSIAELQRDVLGNPLRVVGVIQDITERKKAEEAIESLAVRLNEAQRLAHIGSWELDLINNSLIWTDEIYRIFEIDPDKFGASYEAFLEAIHPEDREAVNSAYTNSLKTRKTYSIDHRLLFSDGRIKYVHEQCETHYDGDKPVRSTGTVQDITERKLAEIKIQESEQLFRALVENSPDFIARYDRKYRRTYANPAIIKLFKGYENNVIGKTPHIKSPIYAPEKYIDYLQQTIDTAEELSFEIPFRSESGVMHWGHIRFLPEFDQEGKVTSVLSIGRDIHEIKENELRFRMLAENFPDFVFRFNRSCQYLYINQTAEKSLDIPKNSFIGRTILELPLSKKAEQNNAIIKLIQLTFSEGKTHDDELHWETKMGERILEIRYIPEKDAAKNIISVLCIAH
ncbi:MAG: PAS domain S-box protein, partial [Chloroflexia bacterium]|nr:PAS domain S-box protein [Chloroflexia bacterium]